MTGILFKNLTQGGLVYVLAKYEDKIQYHEGSIVSVGRPRVELPDYKDQTQITTLPTTRNVIDVTYTVDGKNYTDVADENTNLFSTNKIGKIALVTTEKDNILRELRATLTSSKNYIKEAETEVPRQRERIKQCEALIAEHDTEFAERQKMDERIDKLEKSNTETNELLRQLLKKLDEKAAKS